jgi:hypothetical protein
MRISKVGDREIFSIKLEKDTSIFAQKWTYIFSWMGCFSLAGRGSHGHVNLHIQHILNGMLHSCSFCRPSLQMCVHDWHKVTLTLHTVWTSMSKTQCVYSCLETGNTVKYRLIAAILFHIKISILAIFRIDIAFFGTLPSHNISICRFVVWQTILILIKFIWKSTKIYQIKAVYYAYRIQILIWNIVILFCEPK